jgi:hypothetical protein
MKLTAFTFLLFVLSLLQACGFEAVHGEHQAERFGNSFPAIAIEVPRGRDEQILKTALENRLDPGAHKSAAYPEYRISLSLTTLSQPVVVSGNATVQRYNMEANTSFNLTRVADGKEVLTGQARRFGSYSASRDFFADYTASQDATHRAIEELAADISMRVHSFLLAPQQAQDATP